MVKLIIASVLYFKVLLSFSQEINSFHNKEIRFSKNTTPITGLFNINKKSSIYNLIDSTTFVRINSIDKRKILVELITRDTVLHRVFKGRQMSNGFKIRNKNSINGVPSIFWGWRFQSNKVYYDGNRRLIWEHDHGGLAILGIFPCFATSVGKHQVDIEEL